MDNNDPIVNNNPIETIIKSTNLSDLHHQAILTAIDNQLDLEKNILVKQLNTQEKRQEQIERIAKELKSDIKNLAQIVQGILDKHHKDYVSTFISFMDTVRNDLRQKIDQMKKVEIEKEKLNDANILRCERDYFRMQTFKLNKSNGEYKDKLHDVNIKMTILKDEVSSVTIKWSDSEKVNQQLMIELEAALRDQKELEKELETYKGILKEMNRIRKKNEEINEEEGNNNNGLKDKSYYMIEKLKLDLKREKLRNHRSMSEISNIYQEKNRLENIFINCIEETRKIIYNRKVKENRRLKGRKEHIDGSNNNIKYEAFLPYDKLKIIERFVFNTEIYAKVHDMLFPKSISEEGNENNNTNNHNRNIYHSSFINKQSNTINTSNIFNQITLFNPLEEQSIEKTMVSKDRKTSITFKGKTHNLRILMPIKSNNQ